MSQHDFVINALGHDTILKTLRLQKLVESQTATPVDFDEVSHLLPSRDESLSPQLATRHIPNEGMYVVMRLFTQESERKGDRQYDDFIGRNLCNIAMKYNLDDMVEGRRALLFLAHNEGNENGSIVNYFWGACLFEFHDKFANRVVATRIPTVLSFSPANHL